MCVLYFRYCPLLPVRWTSCERCDHHCLLGLTTNSQTHTQSSKLNKQKEILVVQGLWLSFDQCYVICISANKAGEELCFSSFPSVCLAFRKIFYNNYEITCIKLGKGNFPTSLEECMDVATASHSIAPEEVIKLTPAPIFQNMVEYLSVTMGMATEHI